MSSLEFGRQSTQAAFDWQRLGGHCPLRAQTNWKSMTVSSFQHRMSLQGNGSANKSPVGKSPVGRSPVGMLAWRIPAKQIV